MNKQTFDFPVYVLLKGGYWRKTKEVPTDDYFLIVDPWKLRNTITTNPKTTTNKIEYKGLFWENSLVEYKGDYIIVDEDFVVYLYADIKDEDIDNCVGVLQFKSKPEFFITENGDITELKPYNK